MAKYAIKSNPREYYSNLTQLHFTVLKYQQIMDCLIAFMKRKLSELKPVIMMTHKIITFFRVVTFT